MAELTVKNIARAGVNAGLSAAGANGDSFLNNPLTNIHAKNSDVTNTKTITIAKAISVIQVDRSGEVPVQDLTVNVPPSGEVFFVAPVGSYGAHPTMTYSSSSGLTVEVLRQPII